MIEIDSGYLRGAGIVCPTHKLEIKERKMTEIEKTEGEIKVLQAKLELLKEMEKHRSPAEEAFKEVYGYYPEVCERSVWVPFQKGYEEAQKDYKRVEEPKPPTLLHIVCEWCDDDNDLTCVELVNRIEQWLPGCKKGVGLPEYHLGWNDALRTIKEKLR